MARIRKRKALLGDERRLILAQAHLIEERIKALTPNDRKAGDFFVDTENRELRRNAFEILLSAIQNLSLVAEASGEIRLDASDALTREYLRILSQEFARFTWLSKAFAQELIRRGEL